MYQNNKANGNMSQQTTVLQAYHVLGIELQVKLIQIANYGE